MGCLDAPASAGQLKSRPLGSRASGFGPKHRNLNRQGLGLEFPTGSWKTT